MGGWVFRGDERRSPRHEDGREEMRSGWGQTRAKNYPYFKGKCPPLTGVSWVISWDSQRVSWPVPLSSTLFSHLYVCFLSLINKIKVKFCLMQKWLPFLHVGENMFCKSKVLWPLSQHNALESFSKCWYQYIDLTKYTQHIIWVCYWDIPVPICGTNINPLAQ